MSTCAEQVFILQNTPQILKGRMFCMIVWFMRRRMFIEIIKIREKKAIQSERYAGAEERRV